MSLISKVGRRSFPVRLAFAAMYLVLALGGITMIVPFAVMISNSFKSSVDSQEYDLIPRYWFDNQMLTRKYLEQQFNYDVSLYNGVARTGYATFTKITRLPQPANAAMQEDYYAYLQTLPTVYTILTNRGAPGDPRAFGIHPSVQAYRQWLFKHYSGTQSQALDAIGKTYRIPITDGVESLVPPDETWGARWFQPAYNQQMQEYLQFKSEQPMRNIVPLPAEGGWATELQTKIGADIAAVNAALGTKYADFATLPLPYRQPTAPKLRDAWNAFINSSVPIWFVRLDATARLTWTNFLKRRFSNDLGQYMKGHPQMRVTSFDEIPLPTEDLYKDQLMVSEWTDFISKEIPLAHVYLDTPEFRYREFLRKKYASVAAVNRAYGTHYASLAAVVLPADRVFVSDCQEHQREIRQTFISRNYVSVASYLMLHGRAFFNTVVLIVLTLAFTLSVNPLTAYALSRFKLKATNKLLLFLLATMAFPAEIAMIPNFLLLKDLHLLNSYWALVLPGMASGFSIFLLKGMFDGLPQDLYEAAELDGASEMMIFWKITMPLVKPFLAYLALGTFLGTYSTFMFAFLLCPNPKMWTIMVYLQQMDWASQPVKFAAFVLASIPTLIVFVTCQRVIMQGIVLPTEK